MFKYDLPLFSNMQCEICGAEYAKKRAIIDGSELVVCEICVKYGKEVDSEPKIVMYKVENYSKEPELAELKDNYGQLIIKARQAKNMTIDELAQLIFENHSWLKKVEHGTATPDSKLIAKLEKILSIKLTGE